MAASPDPVTEGIAYREMLIGLVDGADPVEVQTATIDLARTLSDEAGAALRVRPEPAEWSVFECLAHIVDAEIVMTARYRWVLAHDRPELAGYDQDLWIDRLQPSRQEPGQMLALFEALRRANVDLWQRTPVNERARAGLHAERGPETYAEMFTLIAGHDRFHLDQARRALAAVG